MKKTIIILVSICFASCGLTKKMETFAKCDFKLTSIDPITLANINIQKISSFSNLNYLDIAKVTAAAASNALSLNLTANILATNPNSSPAAMTKMDWILDIDKVQITSGILNKRVDVPARGGTASFTVEIKTDLMKVLNGKSLEAIKNFAFGLTGANDKATSRIAFKVKPYITIAGINLPYPDYFTVMSY